MASIKFGTDGWRAVIAEQFTFENVRRIGQALAEYFKTENNIAPRVAVGFDTRFLSEEFAQTLSEVLASNAIEVLLSARYLPTPVLAFSVKKNNLSGGIMVTASHNPAHYNGVKFKASYGGPADSAMTRRIEELIDIREPAFDAASIKRHLHRVDFFPDYCRHIQEYIDSKLLGCWRGKIAYNPMHGAGCGYLEEILDNYGLDFSTLNDKPDPLFGGKLPEPIMANLEDLRERVIHDQAQIGLATDGDADRFGVLDGSGNFVQVHDLMVLISRHLLQTRGWSGDIVRTTSMADTVDALAAEFERRVWEVPVGFKHVTERMLVKDILVGGEESGGFGYKNHIPERDGLLSCLLILEVLAREQKSLSQLVHELRQQYGPFYYDRIDFRGEAGRLAQNLERLRQSPPTAIGNYKISEVDLRDGIKFYFGKKTWMLIRVSQTEPLARIYVAAESANSVVELLQNGKKLINK